MMSRLVPAIVLLIAVGGGLALIEGSGPAGNANGAHDARLDRQGEEFVRIALAFSRHDAGAVDAYFGPDAWRPADTVAAMPLADLARRAHRLLDALDGSPSRRWSALRTGTSGSSPDTSRHAASAGAPPRGASATSIVYASASPDSSQSGTGDARAARRASLLAEVRALTMTIDARASGRRMSFDEEARAIYGMTLEIDADEEDVDAALAALERALPGEGPLAGRFEAYRARFAVPSERRRALFSAALDGCRARARQHWTLPEDERFDVAWQIRASGAWHRYEGNRRSTLTLNPGAVAFIDTAIDLACHEGYPGHHVQFLLEDGSAAGDRDGHAMPVERTLALLRSPVSMLREGAAQYAVDLAFPADERLRFERDVLFPLAGFEPADAARHAEIRRLVRALEPAIVPILRDYRDGRLSSTDAAARLESRALVSSPQALLHFADDLGPYVLGYTVARDRVAARVAHDMQAGHVDAWTALRALLAPPDITALQPAGVPAR